MMIELVLETLGLWLVLTVLGSTFSALAYPLISHSVAASAAPLRSAVRLVYAVFTPVAAGLAIVLITHPELAGFLALGHCHGSQCGAHAPVYADDSQLILGIALAASLVLVAVLVTLFWGVRRVRRQIRALRALSYGPANDYRTVNSEAIFACCVGLWRPYILVSRGLLTQLQPAELEIVLAHEQAHARRFDNLRALILAWSTVFWPAALRNRVRQDSRADAEQACDLAAARGPRTPQTVAHVIRRMSALSGGLAGYPPQPSIGFDCDHAATRVAVISRGDQHRILNSCSPTAYLALALTWCVQVCLLTTLAHLAIEFLS